MNELSQKSNRFTLWRDVRQGTKECAGGAGSGFGNNYSYVSASAFWAL